MWKYLIFFAELLHCISPYICNLSVRKGCVWNFKGFPMVLVRQILVMYHFNLSSRWGSGSRTIPRGRALSGADPVRPPAPSGHFPTGSDRTATWMSCGPHFPWIFDPSCPEYRLFCRDLRDLKIEIFEINDYKRGQWITLGKYVKYIE